MIPDINKLEFCLKKQSRPLLPVHCEDLQQISISDHFDLLAGESRQEKVGEVGFLVSSPPVKNRGERMSVIRIVDADVWFSLLCDHVKENLRVNDLSLQATISPISSESLL